MSLEQAHRDVRIGDFDEALHDADLDLGHGWKSLLGKAAEQEIQLLAAAMGCPVEAAAAADGEIVVRLEGVESGAAAHLSSWLSLRKPGLNAPPKGGLGSRSQRPW